MKPLFTAILLASSLAIVAFKPADSKLDLIKDYKKWTKATKSPVDMSPTLAVLCAGPGPGPTHTGPTPHVPRVFLVYVNEVGSKAMMSKKNVDFPNGTVIVKEKYARPKDAAFYDKVDMKKVLASKPELLTVMVKENGTWNYFAVDDKGKVMDGDTAYCRKCHEAQKAMDYVFRPYVLSNIDFETIRR